MELRAQRAWSRRFANFTRCHNISRLELGAFLREYEQASMAGIRVDPLRPRWDFTGAFYFVGTVVSTIEDDGTCSLIEIETLETVKKYLGNELGRSRQDQALENGTGIDHWN
eukprot:g24481.t1